MRTFNFNNIDSSWHHCLSDALELIDPIYLDNLYRSTDWLPGPTKIFNAFSLPLHNVNYILFGESPYPRAISANGFAFWDAAVTNLWSESGLSKPVNRATSLRNILKMLLIAEGLLTPTQTTQENIAAINKNHLVQTNDEFFTNFQNQGFLLLNATPVLQPTEVRKDARAWQPFLKKVLNYISHERPHVKLILFGRIANEIDSLMEKPVLEKMYAEHPYNVSFITNPDVLAFFKPLHLLKR